MDSGFLSIHSKACRCASIAGLIAVATMPAIGFADGARVGQKAGPGDIVLLRNVATRPADRNPIAPGMALMVNPSPNPQLNNSLNGGGEISDNEIADLTAGVSSRGAGSGQSSMQRSLNTALGINTGGNSAGAASNGVSNVVAGPGPGGGAASITDNTRAIGDQVTNAVSQLPMIGH